MQAVTIYTKDYCPYCQAAMRLLERKGVAYERIEVTSAGEQQAMIARANGKRTVPQIFIGETHVGGSDDLHALESQGRLDALLADRPAV